MLLADSRRRYREWRDKPREDYVRENYLAAAILLIFVVGFIFGLMVAAS